MKTFSQFLLDAEEGKILKIYERYYAPNEPTPSGQTPLRKALRKAVERHHKPDKSKSEEERHEKHKDKIRTQVRHGYDNPIVNPYVSKKYKNKIKTSIDDDGWTNINHRESGVTYHVKNHDDNAYEIHWSHNKNRDDLSPAERVRIGVSASHVFRKHVLPRLRNNKTIVTRALPDESATKKKKKRSNPQTVPSKRADIYANSGFSNRSSTGGITGKVQHRKGKSRIVPLPPIKGELRLYSNTERNKPSNYAADYSKSENSNKKPKATNPKPQIITTFNKNSPSRRKRPQGYSGNIARNNPLNLKDLEYERDVKDYNSDPNYFTY